MSRMFIWVCMTCGAWLHRIGKDTNTCPYCDGCLERLDKNEAE